MSDNNQSSNQGKSGNSGVPTLIQALIGGAIFAAFSSLFIWLGKLISGNPEPPKATDSLHGFTNPMELFKHLNEILSQAHIAINHDTEFVKSMFLIVVLACLLSFLISIIYIFYKRKYRNTRPPAYQTTFLICILSLTPIATSIFIKAKQYSLLHSASIVEQIYNENTEPEIVPVGSKVRVKVPLNIQSWFGYSEVSSSTFNYFRANLIDGTNVTIAFDNPVIIDGGRKPDKTDLIPVIENVNLRAEFNIPSDPKFKGAIIEFAISGNLGVINNGTAKQITGYHDFNANGSFRIADEKEVQFGNEYDRISGKLTKNIYITIIIGVLITIMILIFTQRLKKPDLELEESKSNKS